MNPSLDRRVKPREYNQHYAAKLMHGTEFNGTPLFPCLVSEKLNGLRCMWHPLHGFYSKTGKRWNDGVLNHIEPEGDYILDGELYCKGMSLQQIMDEVPVNARAPGANAEAIEFHVFDILTDESALARWERIKTSLTGRGVTTVQQHHVNRESDYRTHLAYYRAMQCEGMMVKFANARYTPGRKHGNLLKVKFWQTLELPIVSVVEGEGKCAGMVGAFVFKLRGKMFEVGTMQLDYPARMSFFANPYHLMAKIRYLNLSDDGIPLNASVEAVWEEVI